MSNPYAPPKAPLDNTPDEIVYSKDYKREKSALRPLGVVLVVVFFFVFSAVGATLLLIDGDLWWMVYIAVTGLLTYLFRKLWWGDDGERKTAIFVGFFVAALIWLGGPDGSTQSWSASDLADLAEGCYFFLAACYLIYARNSPFFQTPQIL
jgi:hypothetical protein